MRSTGGLDSRGREASEAAWEAGRGAVYGASVYGGVGLVFAGVGQSVWPLYRNLTFQFKVFIQMSSMILGGVLHADKRLRQYEARMRVQRKMAIDRATWERYERDFEESLPPLPSESSSGNSKKT